MLSRIADRNIWLIYVAIFVLGVAYGSSIALTALHLDNIGFSKREIGSLAAVFASGIVVLSLPAGALIRRFSARRTLLACLLGYTLCVTAFPFQHGYLGVGLVRFFDGASSVGIWVSCETILLARSDRSNKAFVMSLYAMAMAIGYLAGAVLAQSIYRVTSSMPIAFVVAGGIALSSTLLVFLRLDHDVPEGQEQVAEGQPAASAVPRLSSVALLYRIKTSCFATFAYGYFQASVVLFLPLFLIEKKGIAREQTILIPAIFALGMLLFANYAGRLGDRVGHLPVMRVLASIGTLMILGFVFLESWALMCGAIFVAGAVLASISPVSLALQGHIAEPRDYSRSNAIYNVFYASGMLLGPPLSSVIFEQHGGEAMLIHLAALWAGFVAFSLLFAKDDPSVARRRASLAAALSILACVAAVSGCSGSSAGTGSQGKGGRAGTASDVSGRGAAGRGSGGSSTLESAGTGGTQTSGPGGAVSAAGGRSGGSGSSGGSGQGPGKDGGSPADAGSAGAAARCAALPEPGSTIEVSNAADLVSTVYDAQPGATIVLSDGTYGLAGKILQVRADNVTLRGKSGDRDKVILDGGYSASSGEIIAITASHATIANLTIAHAYTHAIHVQTSGSDVLGTLIYDVHVLDALEQGIKINLDATTTHFPDQGTIACSQIELTAAGRSQVRNNCYTGGIDAHGARGWTIRDNRIEGFYCAQGLSEHAVHFWTGSRDTIVERNQIRNCARGVGFGLGETTASSSDAWRTYADDPCPNRTPVGHYGGIIRNNFIFANDAALFASDSGFDSGIALEQACNATIVHNTIFASTAPRSSAVEWRFANTSALVVNNLANAPFRDRGAGASATSQGNAETATAGAFVDPAQGDLHLASTASAFQGQGIAVAAGVCDDDIDGEPRARRDLGADEGR